jgi:hypothetical protein
VSKVGQLKRTLVYLQSARGTLGTPYEHLISAIADLEDETSEEIRFAEETNQAESIFLSPKSGYLRSSMSR